MTDASVVRGGSTTSEVQASADANVPVPAAAEVASADGLKCRAAARVEQNALESVVYKAKGEQVFSVCYRKLKFSWFREEIALDGTNRWKLFTSNRGSGKDAKPFVGLEIDRKDFAPAGADGTFAGSHKKYILLREIAVHGEKKHWYKWEEISV